MISMVDLFQKVDFKSHAGLDLTWKIEMDAVSTKEWKCIAHIIMEYSQPFREAIGIPRGGTALGQLLDKYSTRKVSDPICIVDDVMTTGKSMIEERQRLVGMSAGVIGWVVFARGPVPVWCDAVFRMPYKEPDGQVMTLMGIKKEQWQAGKSGY